MARSFVDRLRGSLLFGIRALAGAMIARRADMGPAAAVTAPEKALVWPGVEPDVDFDAAPAVVRLVNVFLRPHEAAVLPFRLEFPFGDPFELDARAGRKDTDTPIATGLAFLDTDKFEEQLIPDLAWMSALLSFVTRSPAYADALITRGGQAGGRWERVRTGIGLPKYGRRRGLPMIRTPADLRQFFDSGWALRVTADFQANVLPIAIEWHNFAHQGRGQHFIEFRLIHQWVALELLAAQWAKRRGRSKLLKRPQMSVARACLEELAEREGLDELTRAGLMDKAAELERTPMRRLVIEYLTDTFEPYPAQPGGAKLEETIGQMIKVRNDIAHKGSLLLHETPGSVDKTLSGMDRLEGITARAILAELGATIPLLTEAPWTEHRAPA